METGEGRRKDRGCGMSPIWAKMMCKSLEQQGKNSKEEVAWFTEALLHGKETAKSTMRKGTEGDLEPQRKNSID